MKLHHRTSITIRISSSCKLSSSMRLSPFTPSSVTFCLRRLEPRLVIGLCSAICQPPALNSAFTSLAASLLGKLVILTSPLPSLSLPARHLRISRPIARIEAHIPSLPRTSPIQATATTNVPVAITLSPPGRRVVQPGTDAGQRYLDTAQLLALPGGRRRDLLGGGQGEERRGAQIPGLRDTE